MRIPVAVVAVLVGFVMPTNLALADTVNIGGTHSADEIRGKCAAAGGSFAVENSGAYSCVVTEKGTAVNCSANGKCRGTVPRGLGARGVKVFQGGGLKVVQDGVKVNQGGVKVFQGGGGQVYQGGGVKVI